MLPDCVRIRTNFSCITTYKITREEELGNTGADESPRRLYFQNGLTFAKCRSQGLLVFETTHVQISDD